MSRSEPEAPKMRKTFVVILALVALTSAPAAYIASPLVTAWSIREAVRNGDSSYLAKKIDFASVRTTLRNSMHQVAFDMPNAEATANNARSKPWSLDAHQVIRRKGRRQPFRKHPHHTRRPVAPLRIPASVPHEHFRRSGRTNAAASPANQTLLETPCPR